MYQKTKEIREEFLKSAVAKYFAKLDIIIDPQACADLDAYRKKATPFNFIKFALSLGSSGLVALFSPRIQVVAALYKDQIIDFKFVSDGNLLRGLKNKQLAKKIWFSLHGDKIGSEAFKDISIQIETIVENPVFQEDIIKEICDKKLDRIGGAILLAIAKNVDAWRKKKRWAKISNLDGYFEEIVQNGNGQINICQMQSSVQNIYTCFCLEGILQGVLNQLENEKNAELVRKIWDRLRIILGYKKDPKKKTECLIKAKFAQIIGTDKQYFSRPGKWKNLFDKNRRQPDGDCAEIEFEGELLEYVQDYWNRNEYTRGLIRSVDDLRRLFEIGNIQFIATQLKIVRKI
jgi:hypothetical protein